MTMSVRGYVFILGILSCAAVFFSFFSPSEGREIFESNGEQAFQEISEQYKTLARERGAKHAFEILLQAKTPPNIDMHLLGHEIGNILYEQEGVEGIANCTQDFRNACSHAVVIGALNEFGTDALPMIRDACKKAPGGSGAYTMCFHGLGHGVFAYYSYSLPETVEFCRSTGTVNYQNEEFSQCVSGAVMELMGGGGHDREAWLLAREKYLDAVHPLRPCDTALIPEETKGLCFIYLTPRLFELAGANLGNPEPTLFPKAFSFCDELSEDYVRLREACFGGFGKEFIVLAGERDIRNVASYSDKAFRRALVWCTLSGISKAEEACVADALSSIFWGGENDPDSAFRFCSLVDEGKVRSACFARLSRDIAHYISSNSLRQELCGRLSTEFQISCLSRGAS